MPQTVEPLRGAPERHPHRKRWTRSEFAQILKLRVLEEGRQELVDGEVLWTSCWPPPHGSTVTKVKRHLGLICGPDYVLTETRVELWDTGPGYDEPEPDVAVTAQPRATYEQLPSAADLRLVVQVADASLRFARATRARLYGRIGVPEYWVLNLAGSQLIVHRQPAADGYAEITAYGPQETVATLARPEALIRVGDLLP